jgi:uncharacterized membrane protein YqaE (UPF0057 family)
VLSGAQNLEAKRKHACATSNILDRRMLRGQTEPDVVPHVRVDCRLDQAGARDFPSESAIAMDLLRILLSILLPPLGVFLQVGLGGQFWLNILLTLLGYIPGVVHAVWIIARR